MAISASEQAYLDKTERSRARRMQWWHAARFGMFIHWGLYAQLGRNEWVMNLERIPVRDYELLADSWHPKPGCAREWAALAKSAGMKYMVLTTKHHEGFLLWDSQMSDYNAVQRGPGRDLVREYVEAAREAGLRVGFYYSLMDWHHPDGARCAVDEAARRRFVDYTHGCVRELCANYGKIDILWYDVSWPLVSPQAWESYRLNAMVRKLQPEILINDRSQLAEDFGTPEEHITAAEGGRAWEACMTFNGSWGWQQTPPEDWHSARAVLNMLRTCAAGGGNLLLNIGPLPDGSAPPEAVERLTTVGRWLDKYGETIYGRLDPAPGLTSALGQWTRKGNRYFFWCTRWPGRELAIGALYSKLTGARLYPDGAPLPFTQTGDRLVISGLPEQCPDDVAQVALIEMTFKSPPQQLFNAGCVKPALALPDLSGKWVSSFVKRLQVSAVQPKTGDAASAPAVRLADPLDWRPMTARGDGFINIHERAGEQDGIVYLADTFTVPHAGVWTLYLGHDGGSQVFVDGASVLSVSERFNPALPGRSKVEVQLSEGAHEIVVALDTADGLGWGIYLCFGIPRGQRGNGAKAVFPRIEGV